MIVDVVIPSKTNYSNLCMVKECIRSLRAAELDIKFNVILVESSAIAEDVGQDITIMYDRPTFCYNAALNMGIAKSVNEWVILANNDLIFHHGFFDWVLSIFCQYPAIRSFSPWNAHGNWHPSVYPADVPNIIPGYRICYEITGWCLMTRREVLNTIDLSERVDFWYSDNIYADELKKNGFIHALLKHSRVDHITSQTVDFRNYDSEIDRVKYLEGIT